MTFFSNIIWRCLAVPALGWLYQRQKSYPVDKSYLTDRSPIHLMKIRRIKCVVWSTDSSVNNYPTDNYSSLARCFALLCKMTIFSYIFTNNMDINGVIVHANFASSGRQSSYDTEFYEVVKFCSNSRCYLTNKPANRNVVYSWSSISNDLLKAFRSQKSQGFLRLGLT